jgi:hypothetical protein
VCTLNVAMATKEEADFKFRPLMLEAMIAAYTIDFQRNSHGCGTYNGVNLLKSFSWVPLGTEAAMIQDSSILLAHTRYATCAKLSSESLQPFSFVNDRYICMHNGIIEFRDKAIKTDTYSDSWHYFNKIFKVYPDLQDMAEAIETIAKFDILSGSYSCFIWDSIDNQGFYWRKGSNMYMGIDEDFVYLSTIDHSDLMQLAMEKIPEVTLYNFYYSFHGNLQIDKEDLKIEKTVNRKPVTSRLKEFEGADTWAKDYGPWDKHRRLYPRDIQDTTFPFCEDNENEGDTPGEDDRGVSMLIEPETFDSYFAKNKVPKQ